MSAIRLLTPIILCAFLASCGGAGEQKPGRVAAEKVISAMTPERLAALQQWTYSGTGNAWYKGSLSQVETTARFEERNDSLILTIRKPAPFIRDFQLDIPVEERLHGLTLIQSVDTCFFISEDALIGPYRWTTLDCSTDTVFKRGNPFRFFQDLTQWKDSLGIEKMERGTEEVIRFYLQEDWVLMYRPEGVAARGEEEAAGSGEMIREHWYLRKEARGKEY
jgi:hypothetical protein